MRKAFNNIVAWLRKFFFPPEGTPMWMRILPYAILGLLTVIVLAGGFVGWEYTNSSEFCGTSCHTMPPEYSAYLVSPHARVQCVECHIGREAFGIKFTRKAGDLRHVFYNLTKTYEYPIRSHQMRPATDSCETCHFPEKFSDDSLREVHSFAHDEANTQTSIFLILKTGGGSAREGLGFGIHWHIENDIYYLPEDELEQEIPYVRVETLDGEIKEYVDIASDFNVNEIDEDELVLMDCITCHNRITHEVSKPTDAVGQAITKGLIPADLPFVVRESVKLLEGEYASKAEALAYMDALGAFYAVNYPEIFETRQGEIELAISTLQDIYDQSVFPDQLFDWDTHPNNLGHKDDPGCFRCHDGNHLTTEGEAVRLECNICHSIPVVKEPTDLTTDIELVSGPEPPSHTNSNWIALHGDVIGPNCASCHPPVDPSVDWTQLVGKPPADESFCGNEACHSNVWTYAGFDEPALQPLLADQREELMPPPTPTASPDGDSGEPVPLTYVDAIEPVFGAVCTACHTGTASGGLDLTNYASLLAGGESGPGVVPNDPDASIIVQVQAAGDHFVNLSEADLATVIDWILAGAPEN